jgi:hypothetical protein
MPEVGPKNIINIRTVSFENFNNIFNTVEGSVGYYPRTDEPAGQNLGTDYYYTAQLLVHF